MSINFPPRAFRVRSTELLEIEYKHQRTCRIEAMANSMIEMFGDRAQSVADGQPGHRDVGGGCGICWNEISSALRS